MPRQPLELRVDRLEDRVSELEGLPERVAELGAQISHLRGEMRAEFSATRGELRQEMRDGDEETRRQMRVLHEDLVGRIALIREGRPRRRPRTG